MTDQPRIPRDDEDAEFKAWRDSLTPRDEDVPASVTFMQIMRAAAERAAPTADDDQPISAAAPADVEENAARERPRRRRIAPPPLTSDDISAAVQAAAHGKAPYRDVPPPASPTSRVSDNARTRSSLPESDAASSLVADAADDGAAWRSGEAAAMPDAHDAMIRDAENDATARTSHEPHAAPDASADARAPADDEAVLQERRRQRLLEQRRARSKRRQRPTSAAAGFVRSILLVVAAAGLMATIFTWWTPPRFISANVSQQLSAALETSSAAGSVVTPTVIPTQPRPVGADGQALRIGIVSGHRGNDSGAVCDDGLTEAEINFNVVSYIVRDLRTLGYTVDLLDEFDARLNNYQAVALVSIHANTCQDYGYPVSGYLISAAAARITTRSVDDLLVECVAREYEAVSGLLRRPGVTRDMTDYHAFREIHPQTPAAILELGFMRTDRDVLTSNPERLARGIVNGVLCFVEPARDVLMPTAAPENTEPPA